MKEIKAFMRPSSASDVVRALRTEGVSSITVFLGEGTGNLAREDAFPSFAFTITHSHIFKIEIICQDDVVEKVLRTISLHGRTSEPGDGIIYVTDVEGVYRIKTGERYVTL